MHGSFPRPSGNAFDDSYFFKHMSEIQFPLIMLAAGKSSRMGEPKGLVRVGKRSRPWIEIQLRRFLAAGGADAIVVLGYDRDRYLEELPWLVREGTEELPVIDLVVNPKPERGPFSSLMEGWRFLRKKWPGSPVFILPVDVPCPSGQVFQALSNAIEPGIEACVPFCQNRGGHPVLAAASFMEKLDSLPITDPNSRLDWQIRSLPPESLGKVPVEEKLVLLNMNRKKDFLAAGKWLEGL